MIDGKAYHGMANIGYRPTFRADQQLTIEVNIFDFSEEIYNKAIRIAFLHRVRDERKFSSKEDLISQLVEDKKQCLNLLTTLSSKGL